MAYAELKVYSDGRVVGEAIYASRRGGASLSKFIRAEQKIKELVDLLFPKVRAVEGARGTVHSGANAHRAARDGTHGRFDAAPPIDIEHSRQARGPLPPRAGDREVKMFPWLWFWAPQLHFPLSGSVAQRIEPNTNWFFDSIAPQGGNGRIERKAFEVASYGRQLGLITEVLLDLAECDAPRSAEARASLARLQAIRAAIGRIKDDDYDALARDLEDRLRQLRRNPAAFDRVAARLRRALDDESAAAPASGRLEPPR